MVTRLKRRDRAGALGGARQRGPTPPIGGPARERFAQHAVEKPGTPGQCGLAWMWFGSDLDDDSDAVHNPRISGGLSMRAGFKAKRRFWFEIGMFRPAPSGALAEESPKHHSLYEWARSLKERAKTPRGPRDRRTRRK